MLTIWGHCERCGTALWAGWEVISLPTYPYVSLVRIGPKDYAPEKGGAYCDQCKKAIAAMCKDRDIGKVLALMDAHDKARGLK